MEGMKISGDARTFENVKEAFQQECTAIIRYLIYADIADNEGKIEAAELFRKMANNEIEHAKLWCKNLEDFSKDTVSNLKIAAGNENQEWKEMYPQNSKVAAEEGFHEIATLFERVASIECDHERKFLEQAMMIENGGRDFVEEEKAEKRYCLFCGYGTEEVLEVCPVCGGVDSF